MQYRKAGSRAAAMTAAVIGLVGMAGCGQSSGPPLAHRRGQPAAPQSPFVTPVGIVLHDSDTPAKWHGVVCDEKYLDRLHAREHPGWATVYDGHVYHIGYHFVILPDGVVQDGRPIGCVGAHARTHNNWIGICLIGGFSTNRRWWPERPTAAQMRSLTRLCEQLMSRYHIPPEYVKRHRDLNDTWCPGDRFPYRRLMAGLDRYAASHPDTQAPAGRVVSLAIPKPHARRTYPAVGKQG